MSEVLELVVCCQCDGEYGRDEVREFDGELLCSDCLDDNTFVCSRCGDRFWDDDNHGDSDTQLCEDCYDNHYARCESCRYIISRDYANYEESDEDSDYPYCDSCYSSRSKERYLHDYGYKPEPVFYGDGKRFFGVELEVDGAGKSNEYAKILTELTNESTDHIYIKIDSSLDDGMEIVTHPMTLDYHISKMPWLELVNRALELGYKSHKTSTAGLHIHVNRGSFGTDVKKQDECIARILFFVERFWQELLRFSRRTPEQLQKWANRYGYKDNPSEILDHAKKGYGGRYTAINITNYHTIEFRLFRGTLKINTIIATLELVDNVCQLALAMSDEELSALSWCEFVELINKDKNPELITYLKERRLYINEPIETEDDE